MFWKIIFWIYTALGAEYLILLPKNYANFINNPYVSFWGDTLFCIAFWSVAIFFVLLTTLIIIVALYQLAWNKTLIKQKVLKFLFWLPIMPFFAHAIFIDIFYKFFTVISYNSPSGLKLLILTITALVGVIYNILVLVGCYLSAYKDVKSKASKIVFIILTILFVAIPVYCGIYDISLKPDDIEIVTERVRPNEGFCNENGGRIYWIEGTIENKTRKFIPSVWLAVDLYDKNGVKLQKQSYMPAFNSNMDIPVGNFIKPKERFDFKHFIDVCGRKYSYDEFKDYKIRRAIMRPDGKFVVEP